MSDKSETQEEILQLKTKIRDLERRIANASILLWDWDGYYNDQLKKGDAHGLAGIVYEAYTCLQGKGWKETDHAKEHNGAHGAD